MQQAELYHGGQPQPTSLATPEIPWTELGALTVQQAYPAVTARDYPTVIALVAANRVLWRIHNFATGFMLRFQTSADGNAQAVSLLGFAAAKALDASGAWIDDRAMFLGSLILTGGLQTGAHANVFVDTIAATDGLWGFSELDSGNDRVAAVKGDTKGIKEVVVIATTLVGGSTLYVEGRTY